MQPSPPAHMAYDRTIIVFSPDGRLLQVEYARQAVKKGNTSVGLKTNSAVVLGAMKNVSDLGVEESHKKVYEIDDHIGVTSSGLLADARELINMARVRAQIHTVTYGTKISVAKATSHIADRKHLVTQYAGVRPYGIGFLIGGVDDSGTSLFETDPSGTIMEWKGQAIGSGAEKAKKILKSKYKQDLTEEQSIKVVLEALKSGEKLTTENVEIGVINKSGFRRLDAKELSKYL